MKRWLFLCIFVFLISFTSAQINASLSSNATNYEIQAKSCINESYHILKNMQENNFSVLRVNDSLKQALTLYDSQSVLKDKKKKYDFSIVIPYCDEIKNITEDADNARDEIIVLERVYSISIESGMNSSSIDSLILEINQEMTNERYEKVDPLVQKAHSEITRVTSEYTTLGIFYDSTTKGIKSFLKENWIWIVSSLVFLIILYWIYRKTIRRWKVRRKIEKLNLRKKTLKDMIMATQKDYFNLGKISENTFSVRTKKLAELVRDIDRQIPLLEEEIMKLKRKV